MAKNTPKYEQLYQKERDVCGSPFQEFVEFFNTLDKKNCQVLDLGCGQGRDALLIARKGHDVLGVDLSETGIAQMLAEATKEGLNVKGIVADIVEFEPPEEYDVILLDRVLHMLPGNDDRINVLETVCHHTKPGGFILIADTPKNHGLLLQFFASKQSQWKQLMAKKGFLFLQRELVP
jgi:2-polyprenyl-3-methyl-5-hydroxy-6-metoxy-1,4-benzoquinol methylase